MPSQKAIELMWAMKGHRWWDDLRFPAQAIRAGANAPTWNTTFIGWEFDDAPPFNEEVQLTAQLPHAFEEDSLLWFHIHWILTVNGGAGEDVKWDILYRHADIGGTWAAGFVNQSETVDVSANVAREHLITTFSTGVQNTLAISGMYDIRLQRDTADAADDHPQPVVLKEFDIHYPIDAPGSWDINDKWG